MYTSNRSKHFAVLRLIYPELHYIKIEAWLHFKVGLVIFVIKNDLNDCKIFDIIFKQICTIVSVEVNISIY